MRGTNVSYKKTACNQGPESSNINETQFLCKKLSTELEVPLTTKLYKVIKVITVMIFSLESNPDRLTAPFGGSHKLRTHSRGGRGGHVIADKERKIL